MTSTPMLLGDLRREIELALNPMATRAHDHVLLDFPNHTNVGDSAIWLGETAFLRSATGRAPAYVCDLNDYSPDELNAASPGGAIFLHGGGNFGDLWIRHQELREAVLVDFPDREVIQLPQSIHFEHADALDRARRAVGRHKRFTLVVRDHRSLELARSFDCEVRLCPDTALYLGPAQARSPLDANPVYGLFRDDKERVADRLLEATAARVPAADWLSEDEAAMRQRELDWIAQSGKAAGWEQLAQARLERGLDMLSRGRAVVTDRLHAHILSMLLGFPNLVFDNSYGKVWAFIETWTQDSELVTPARSADVVEAWLQLHQGPEAGVSG